MRLPLLESMRVRVKQSSVFAIRSDAQSASVAVYLSFMRVCNACERLRMLHTAQQRRTRRPHVTHGAESWHSPHRVGWVEHICLCACKSYSVMRYIPRGEIVCMWMMRVMAVSSFITRGQNAIHIAHKIFHYHTQLLDSLGVVLRKPSVSYICYEL